MNEFDEISMWICLGLLFIANFIVWIDDIRRKK